MEQPTSRRKKEKPLQRQCHRCNGTGLAPCNICGGSGQVVRGNDLNGRPQFIRCEGCFGTKTSRCKTCGGERYV